MSVGRRSATQGFRIYLEGDFLGAVERARASEREEAAAVDCAAGFDTIGVRAAEAAVSGPRRLGSLTGATVVTAAMGAVALLALSRSHGAPPIAPRAARSRAVGAVVARPRTALAAGRPRRALVASGLRHLRAPRVRSAQRRSRATMGSETLGTARMRGSSVSAPGSTSAPSGAASASGSVRRRADFTFER
jgi:hypothetical protein